MRGIQKRIMLCFCMAFISAFAMANGGASAGAPSPYFNFDPNFVTNILDKQGNISLLQVKMQLLLGSPESSEALKHIEPQLRHDILALLATQPREKMATLSGQNDLRKEIVAVVMKSAESAHGGGGHGKEKPDPKDKLVIKQVLFTDFMLQ